MAGVIEVARVSDRSWVHPRFFFEKWCDLATHPEWAPGMQFLRLDEPFALGARGVLKLVGGRESPFVVTELIDGTVYADTTELDGAGLTVRHEATPHGTGSRLELTCVIEGPREAHWAREVEGIEQSLADDLASLVALAERVAR